MKFVIVNFALLLLLSCSNAQDNYTFKIGKDITEFPIEFEDMGPVGITDMAVYGDMVYSLENSRIHIMPLKSNTGHYVTIPLGKGEKAVAINILSEDTVAVVVSYPSRRSAGVVLLAAQTGKVLNKIDYHREAGSLDDQIVVRDNQSTAYIRGKLYVPVTDTRNLDNDPASFLVVSLTKKKCKLQKQADFFKEGYVKARTITSFCDSLQMFTRTTRGEYQARINNVDKDVTVKFERKGEPLNVPFKLDCRFGKLWYWQTVNDSAVVISSLKLFE